MIINKDLFLLYPVTIQYVPVPAGRLNNFFVIMLKIVTFIHEKTLNMLYYFIGNWVSEWLMFNILIFIMVTKTNKRLPGACNRSHGSKLLSITTQLHCGGHLGGRARLPDTFLEDDHPMTIPSKLGSNWATGSRQDGFYVNFPYGPMLN